MQWWRQTTQESSLYLYDVGPIRVRDQSALMGSGLYAMDSCYLCPALLPSSSVALGCWQPNLLSKCYGLLSIEGIWPRYNRLPLDWSLVFLIPVPQMKLQDQGQLPLLECTPQPTFRPLLDLHLTSFLDLDHWSSRHWIKRLIWKLFRCLQVLVI